MKYLLLAAMVLFFGVCCHAESAYSGLEYCVYPGSLIGVNLSHLFSISEDLLARVYPEQSIVELYDGNGETGASLTSKAGEGVSLRDLKYIKIAGISGPFFSVLIKVYDENGFELAEVNSGRICNLDWTREKHGAAFHYKLESRTSVIDKAVLSRGAPTAKKISIYCLTCLALGAAMGFGFFKMLEY